MIDRIVEVMVDLPQGIRLVQHIVVDAYTDTKSHGGGVMSTRKYIVQPVNEFDSTGYRFKQIELHEIVKIVQ